MKKEARNCSKELQENVRTVEETITRNLARAERENATVYLQVGAHPSSCHSQGLSPLMLLQATIFAQDLLHPQRPKAGKSDQNKI